MANSTQDTCVCVFAHPFPKRTKQSPDQFTVDVFISVGVFSDTPIIYSQFKVSNKINRTITRTWHYSRRAFLSASRPEQHEIMSTMIRDLQIPFPLENTRWGLEFQKSRPENLDEIIDARFLEIARLSCEKGNEQNGSFMQIHVTEFGKVESLEKFFEKDEKPKGPLDDWILENEKDCNLHTPQCFGVIFELGRKAPEDNKFFGLRSVKVTEESDCCSICMKELIKRGKHAIRMPCSHVFHGFCIFQWLGVRPTCPLCMFELYRPEPSPSEHGQQDRSRTEMDDVSTRAAVGMVESGGLQSGGTRVLSTRRDRLKGMGLVTGRRRRDRHKATEQSGQKSRRVSRKFVFTSNVLAASVSFYFFSAFLVLNFLSLVSKK